MKVQRSLESMLKFRCGIMCIICSEISFGVVFVGLALVIVMCHYNRKLNSSEALRQWKFQNLSKGFPEWKLCPWDPPHPFVCARIILILNFAGRNCDRLYNCLSRLFVFECDFRSNTRPTEEYSFNVKYVVELFRSNYCLCVCVHNIYVHTYVSFRLLILWLFNEMIK